MRILQALAGRVFPGSIKRPLRELHQNFVFRRAMRRLLTLAPGEEPSADLLAELTYGWGNRWSAQPELIASFWRLARTADGPILECGSGLSTVLLGVAAGPRKRVWSLEHLPYWAERTGRILKRFGLTNVELCSAPLRDYGPFTWYDPPAGRMPRDFALVVCDGPPGYTPGGRYGLLPVLGKHLRPGCAVLLDDAGREREQEILRRWAEEWGGRFTISGTEKPFGTLVLGRETQAGAG